jgi:HEAT repeat protein
MTAAELRARLSMIEPTESMYEGITQADVPLLEELISDREEWLAARAVFALSRVGTPDSLAAVTRAAADPRPPVRVAVAASVSQRPITLPDDVLVQLLRDRDAGVRKFAPLAVKPENGREPRAVLDRVAADDAVPVVRENAAEALRRIR